MPGPLGLLINCQIRKMSSPTPLLSKTDRLTKRMRRYTSVERLLLMRNLCYGGSAACLVILLGLTQTSANNCSLQVSVIAAAISMPLWLVLGGTYEFYIFLGKPSYAHRRTRFTKNFIGGVGTLAGTSLYISVVAIINFLMPIAMWVFISSTLLSFFLYYLFHALLARWWYSSNGPKEGEANENLAHYSSGAPNGPP